jgi:DNA-directed RNA polymerase subunit RPC12/RpoP
MIDRSHRAESSQRMPKPRSLRHLDRCPQCGFRFRGRPEDHQHLSPLGRRLQWAGYFAIFPMMLAIVVFIAVTRTERGMVDFDGRDNLIMLVIFLPSIVFFILSMVVPKQQTYRCPQCSWQRTLRPGDRVDPVTPAPDKPTTRTDDSAP